MERNPVGSIVIIILFTFVLFFVLDPITSSGKPQSTNQSEPSKRVTLATTASSSLSETETTTEAEALGVVLGPGTYTIGKDLAAGTYDCIASSGFGILRGEVDAFVAPFIQTMGVESDYIDCAHSYSNLTLADGDVIYIEMSLNVEFVEK